MVFVVLKFGKILESGFGFPSSGMGIVTHRDPPGEMGDAKAGME